MLPLQDVLPSRRAPWVTITLVGVGTASLLYQMTLSVPEWRGLFLSVGLIPARASWWAAVASLLLFAGPVPAVANLWALWIFGDNLEDRLGRWRYLVLVLLSGLVAAGAAVAMDPRSTVPLAGPSGAVAGVIGGHLALIPRSRVLVLIPLWRTLDLIEMPALIVVAFWLFGQGVGQPGVLAATLVIPLAGFAAGAGAAFILRRPDRMRVEWWSP